MLLSEKAGQIRQMRSSTRYYIFGTVVLQQDHSVAVQIKAKMTIDSKSCYKYPGDSSNERPGWRGARIRM